MFAEILLKLSPLDRLYSALTSRRFARTVSECRMLHDVQLVVPDLRLDEAIDALLGSQRRYTSLKLDQGERLLVLRFVKALLAHRTA